MASAVARTSITMPHSGATFRSDIDIGVLVVSVGFTGTSDSVCHVPPRRFTYRLVMLLSLFRNRWGDLRPVSSMACRMQALGSKNNLRLTSYFQVSPCILSFLRAEPPA